MTSENENQQPSSQENQTEERIHPSWANPRYVQHRIEIMTKALQHNDGLLADGLANLEMRLNLVMAILHDIVNKQVAYVGKEPGDQCLGRERRHIDVEYYYDTYMRTVAEKDAAAAAAIEQTATPHKTHIEVEYPKNAVIFGGK